MPLARLACGAGANAGWEVVVGAGWVVAGGVSSVEESWYAAATSSSSSSLVIASRLPQTILTRSMSPW